MTNDTATTPENESLYHRLLRTHPVYSRLKPQKTEVQRIAVKIERPSAVTVISTANKATDNKAATKSATVNTSSTTVHVANDNNIDDNDDDITLDGLDDPNVLTQWEPINNNKQTQQHEFRWEIGDTVELQSDVEGSIFSDFAIIIGTNDDGTYNMKNILTGGWKKSVPPNKIHGTYDDLLANSKSNTKSNTKSNSSDGGDDREDGDRDESEEEEYCEDDDDSEGESQSSSIGDDSEEFILI